MIDRFLSWGRLRAPGRVLACVVLMLSACVTARGDDALTRERLPSGLEVWVHPVPGSGEVAVGLVIRAGALDESDTQRGAAYVAKRAAGFGTDHATPEQLSVFRTRMGHAEDRLDTRTGYHAYVTHSGVAYRLVFDVADQGNERAWGLALAHMRDLVDGWSPSDAAVEAAIAASLERTKPTQPESIARLRFIAEVFEGERLGERPIVPGPDVLGALTPASVRSYVRERYTPGAATLVIVGDVDPGEAIARVRDAMGDVERRVARPPVPAIATRSIGDRVSAHAIEGYPDYETSLIAVVAAPGGSTPEDGVLDRVASELLASRLRPAVRAAEPDARGIEVAITDAIRGVRVAEVSVKSEAPGFAQASLAAASELGEVLRRGFTPDEFLAARAAVLGMYDERARDWHPVSAERLFQELVLATATGRRWITPPDERELAARTLARTTDDRLLERVRRTFDPRALNCVLLAPEPTAGLSREDGFAVIEAARRTDTPRARLEIPDRLATGGNPASIVEVSHDPGSGVWSGTLGNGLIVRARGMSGADETIVRVGFAAGVVDEDGRTIGRTRDALAAWAYPRIGAHGAGVVHAWAAQRGIRFEASVDQNRAVIDLTGPPGSEGDALALASWLIGSARVDPEYIGRVHTADRQGVPTLEVLGRLMLAPGDPRAGPAPANDRVDASVASRWLTRLCAAPAEISVVGDLDPAGVLEQARATLGTLPMRATPDRSWCERWGALPASETTARVASDRGHEGFAMGVVFADANDLAYVRPVVIGARAIDAFLKRRSALGEAAGGLPDEADAFVWLGDGIPERVTLIAWISADPGRAERAGAALESAIDAFLDDPAHLPETDALIEIAIAQSLENVDKAVERPGFWSRRLAGLSAFGLEIDALSDMREAYASITTEDVRAALRRAMIEGVHKRVIMGPGEPSGR